MKTILITLSLIFSLSTFAQCRVITHKTTPLIAIETIVSLQTLEGLGPNIKFGKFLKSPDFGIKLMTSESDSGLSNIFGEMIMNYAYSFDIYQNKNIIAKSIQSRDINAVTKNLFTKLNDLNCN